MQLTKLKLFCLNNFCVFSEIDQNDLGSKGSIGNSKTIINEEVMQFIVYIWLALSG